MRVGRSYLPPPPILTPWSPEMFGGILLSMGVSTLASLTSATPTANAMTAYPFTLRVPAKVRQLLLWIGATSTGNVRVGIYDREWNLVVDSGSVSMGTANTVQEFNVTDTELAPGEYYLAWAVSAGTLFLVTINDEAALSEVPVYAQSVTGADLPDPAAPAVTTNTIVQIPCVGVQFASTF